MKTKTHILIVEDEEDIRDCLREVFEIEGFDITTANNGKTAIETLKSTEKPDLILLDLMMPEMNGEEFVKHYQATNTQNVPIIIMSADTNAAERAKKMGIQKYIKKPLELEDLMHTIKECCA